MPLNLKNTVAATITAFAIAAGAAAPAHALGSNERKFLQGVAAAVIVGTILTQSNRAQPAAPQPVYRPAPEEPTVRRDERHDQRHDRRDRRDRRSDERRDPAPVYYQEQPRYEAPIPQGRIIGADMSGNSSAASAGLAQTPTARAFNSYSLAERRAVQRRLAGFGYYDGAIDGAFGPRTHQALYAFAGTANKQSALESTNGSFAILDALLG